MINIESKTGTKYSLVNTSCKARLGQGLNMAQFTRSPSLTTLYAIVQCPWTSESLMRGRLAGEVWLKLFRRSFLGCWMLENADDSVHPTAWHCSAGNIWWQFIHSHMRKSGDKVLHEFSMAIWQPPLLKMAAVWG